MHGDELRRPRRRALLRALSGGSLAGLAGCSALLDEGCNGVALALELTPSKSGEQDVLDFDGMDLTQQEQDVLVTATQERVVGCTRNDIDALERLVTAVATHAGLSEHDVYYTEGRATTKVLFRDTRYRAVIIYDTAESGGGPLGA